MIRLDCALVRSAPEMASLEILARTLEATLVALAVAHPCVGADSPCTCALAPCHLAETIHDHIDRLDDAILNYRADVEEALAAETDKALPF